MFFPSPADGAEVSSPVYVTLGAENFTIEPAGEVKAGTYETPVLAPGAKFKVKVVVTVRATTPIGASLTGSLTATSTTHPTFKDKVKFVTRCV